MFYLDSRFGLWASMAINTGAPAVNLGLGNDCWLDILWGNSMGCSVRPFACCTDKVAYNKLWVSQYDHCTCHIGDR